MGPNGTAKIAVYTAKLRKPSSPAHPERADIEHETMDQITPSTRENEKSGNRVARNCRSCRLPRQSTIRVTLDTYTQAIATEKRNAQDPWSRCCSEERRKNQALPGRDSTVCTYFVSLCGCAKNGTFLIRCLILNRGATVSNPRPLP